MLFVRLLIITFIEFLFVCSLSRPLVGIEMRYCSSCSLAAVKTKEPPRPLYESTCSSEQEEPQHDRFACLLFCTVTNLSVLSGAAKRISLHSVLWLVRTQQDNQLIASNNGCLLSLEQCTGQLELLLAPNLIARESDQIGQSFSFLDHMLHQVVQFGSDEHDERGNSSWSLRADLLKENNLMIFDTCPKRVGPHKGAIVRLGCSY